MAKPTPVNAESLVMASLLVSLLSSRFTRTLSRNKYFTPALEYFRVAKGNVALLKATAEWIKESPLKGYLASGSTSANQDAPRPPVPTSGQSIVEENVTVCSPNPKQSFLFVHQSGPSLDDHAKSNVRSYVMTDYRSSKRKDAGQHRMGRDSDRAFSVYVHQTSGNKNTIPKDLLEVIAPPEDPTFSYLLTDVPSDHPDHNAYGAYLAHLSSTLLAIRNGEPKHLVRRRISTMPARTPMEFIELVRKEDKRALVMMMHHYALLKLVDDVWWIQGTPEYNFEGLRKIVGKEWDWALERPLAVMRKVETNQLKS
ncbi:MAG: hypothetical protein M1821_000972 [Bathelium mastoideum]|nr:MAG: hypothetical protein M1821_000972 [Bathelium mastoideum]KAI9694000.1 MAG: hypothetical protein M1822_003271 [Bathelium mastoideum]